MSVVLPLPSPQLITTVCVSSVAGSRKLPLNQVMSFSLMLAALRDNCTADGATSLTVTLVLPLPLAPSLSVTVALMA